MRHTTGTMGCLGSSGVRRSPPGWTGRLLLAGLALAGWALEATAQPESVVGTVHNLSVSGPGEIRALSEKQVCKFCHIPHTAVEPTPLWGHALSQVSQYQVPRIRGRNGVRQPAPQPDGSSRLCLSCHDGTVALGDVAGERQPITMAGSQRLAPGRRGYLGTDLSGSHPVSFVVPNGELVPADSDLDMGLRPLAAIRSDPRVKLDQAGKMQCTTCHDPHTDRFFKPGQVPRFWVKPTVTEVCVTCHELR